MKLALSLQDGISVLSGSGEISPHDVAVLRAGLTKLLRSGRNRIVLDLPEAKSFPAELLAEVSKLDQLARELSGRIALACKKELTQSSAFQCFESKDLALESFRKPAAPPAPAPAAPPAPAQPGEPPVDPQKAFKEELRQRELGETGELRKRAERLEQENKVLLEQLHAAWLKGVQHAPPNTHDAEVDVLRQQIQSLLNEVKALQGSAGAKPSSS